MNELVDKFIDIERGLSEENGPFSLFALFHREESPGKWDVVAAAPWFESRDMHALKLVSDALGAELGTEELMSISRIVLLDADNPGLKPIHRAFTVEHGSVEIIDSDFFGMRMSHAYLITSKRDAATANVASS